MPRAEARRILLEFVLPSVVWPVISALLQASQYSVKPCLALHITGDLKHPDVDIDVTYFQTGLFLTLVLVTSVVGLISTQVAAASVWLERRTGPRSSPQKFLDRLAWVWGFTSAVLVGLLHRIIPGYWPC